MTSTSSTGISHDAFFMAAVKKLPEELQVALKSAGLDDPGLLAVYPRTHWRTLGLKPIGTRDPCRARSKSPISRRSTISLTVSSGIPPTLPFPTSSPPCFSPSSSVEASVVRSLVNSSSSAQSAGVGESSEATGKRGEQHGREAVLGEAGRGGETAEGEAGRSVGLVGATGMASGEKLCDGSVSGVAEVGAELVDGCSFTGYTQNERDGSSSCDRIQRDGSRSNPSQRSGAADELSELAHTPNSTATSPTSHARTTTIRPITEHTTNTICVVRSTGAQSSLHETPLHAQHEPSSSSTVTSTTPLGVSKLPKKLRRRVEKSQAVMCEKEYTESEK